MGVTVISIVIGVFSTVKNHFLKRRENLKIRGQVETIQNTALLRSKKSYGDFGDLLSLRPLEIPSDNAGVKKNLKRVKKIILIRKIT